MTFSEQILTGVIVFVLGGLWWGLTSIVIQWLVDGVDKKINNNTKKKINDKS